MRPIPLRFATPAVATMVFLLLFAGSAARANNDGAPDADPKDGGQRGPTTYEQLGETVVVTATRTERPLREVAATVSVITSETIEAELVQDIADLARFAPGIAVGGTGSRFGLSGFAIRGIGGNRVVTLVDGVRVADQFAFGPFLNARRDFADVDSLARAEIARGPISSLYGSDALGGVVSLTTKRPRDFLRQGQGFAAGFKGGYGSADQSVTGTLSLAADSDALGGVVLYTRRSGHETANMGQRGGHGPEREQPDPQSIDQRNVTAKLAWRPSANHEVTVSAERYANDTDTEMLSDQGTAIRGNVVVRRTAADGRERRRVTAQYRYQGNMGVADELRATIYRQSSETEQLTREDRNTPRRAKQMRQRLSRFDQNIRGGLVQLTKAARTGTADHSVTYGLDYYVTDNSALRDGATYTATGVPVRDFPPLPTRDFPPTSVTHQAFFAQDEITLLAGRLLLTPGVRFDRFKADVGVDDIYLAGNPGAPMPADYEDSEATVTVGAVWALNESVSTYLRYSEGFRAPGFSEVNVGNTNVVFGYKTIANPNLAAERSQGVEGGVRFRGQRGTVDLTLYRNDYRDFIESLAIAPAFVATRGIDPADGLITFQSVNRANVQIRGWELTSELALGNFLSFKAAIAYATGKDETSGAPLNSVEPLTGVFGIGYGAPRGNWGADLMWTVVRGKDVSDVNIGDVGDANGTDAAPSGLDLRFGPPPSGYGVVDLLAYVDIGERARLNAGVFNLADKAYIRWADTIGIVADAPARFTQPGRNASVSLRVSF